MYRLDEIGTNLKIKKINLENHDYLIISEEFAENLLKEIEKEEFSRHKFYKTIEELKLIPIMYLGMKVFVDEDLEGDTFKIR